MRLEIDSERQMAKPKEKQKLMVIETEKLTDFQKDSLMVKLTD